MTISKSLLAILFLSGIACAKKTPPPRPVGNQAAFVESFSPVEVTIRSTGVGNEPEEAEADIPRVAIEFVLLRAPDRLLSTEDEIQQAKRYLDDIYAHPDKYVTWKAEKVTSTRKLPDDRYEVTRMIRIHKGMLNDFFVSKGVLSSREELASDVGNPVIMIVPEAASGTSFLQVLNSNPLASHTAAAIGSYLTQRQYEVVDPHGIAQIVQDNEDLDKLSGSQDMTLMIAQRTGADIYVAFSGRVDPVPGGRKASLEVKARETSTGRLLGTETGYSQTRPNAPDQVLVEEAVSDAIDKVLQRVQNYWKADQAKGIQYTLVFNFPEGLTSDRKQEITSGLRGLMSKNFPEKKLNQGTDRTSSYTVWVPKNKFSDAEAIAAFFEENLPNIGAKVGKTTLNRRFIKLELSAGR